MDHPRCARCQDIIGVYEPMMVILRDGNECAGSRLTLESELNEPGSVTLHDHCHHAVVVDLYPGRC